MAQTVASRATLGVSYLLHQTEGERVTQEVGVDMAAMPAKYLDIAGKGAYDLLSDAVAEASFSTALRSFPWRLELFGSTGRPVACCPPPRSSPYSVTFLRRPSEPW